MTECPYRGLLAFEADNRELFFGREHVVADLIGRVEPARLLALVGASGSGKSSVLRAGLVGAARSGEVAGVEHAVLSTPGAEPELDVPDDPNRLVVIDQFEELFTLCADGGRRDAYIDALLRLHCPVVIGMRADLYGGLSSHAELARAVAANQILLGAMTAAELERAVTEPSRLAGLKLEPGLVELILRDVAAEPGALPLLSHALQATWERRDGRTLTVDGYRDSGGVASAIARTADSVVDLLPAEQRQHVRRVYVRMTELGEGTEDSRRRVTVDELVPEGASPGTVHALLERLAEARLVTLDDGTAEVAHEALIREWPRLRGWLDEDRAGVLAQRQLSDAARLWDAGGRETSDLYRGARLAGAVELAEAERAELNATERAFLDAGVAAADRERHAQQTANRRLRGLLAAALVALVVAGAAAVVALDQRTDARDAATVADAQRLGTQALTDDRLDRALLLARTGVELDDSVATRGNLLATLLRVQAGSLGVLPDVRDVEIYSVAVSPRGDRLAVGDAFGEIQIFDPQTRRRLGGYRLQPGLVQRLAYSPDGATLAVTSLDTSAAPPDTVLELLDARSLRRRLRVVLPRLPKPTEFVGASPAFTANGRDLVVLQSPFPNEQPEVLRRIDGRSGAVARRAFRFRGVALDPVVTSDRRRVLVTSAQDDATYELDTADLGVVARHPAGGLAVALHPDDRTLALARKDGTLGLVDMRSSRLRRLAGRHRADVLRMSFTPDGNTLASVAGDGELIVWDAGKGVVKERLDAHAGSAEGLAIAPDGRTAVSSGVDGRVAFWDLVGAGRLVRSVPLSRPFEVDDFTPRGIAVSPDDRTLAVTQSDGTVDLLDIATLERRASVRAGGGAALALDFSPDGRLLAVGGERGRVSLWDARTLAPVGRLAGLRAWTQAVAFSPDGRLLAAADVNTERPRLRIWDVRRRALTAFRSGSPANSLAFSPDGRLIAGAGGEQGTEVRDVRTSRLVAHPRTGELARSVAFSPDGRLLFVGLFNGAGQFFSTHDWRPVGAPIRGQGQRLLNPRFTPDGRTLATSSADGTVLLWDVASRKPIGSPLMVEPEAFVAAALSRDGAYLYALPTGTEGVRLELSPQVWKRQACVIAGRELSRREWVDALPGRPYRAVCGGG